MQELRSPLHAGLQVDVRNEAWQIVDREEFDAVSLVTLRGLGRDNLGETARILIPFDRVRTIRPPTTLTSRSRASVIRSVIGVCAESHRWEDCWTAADARMDVRPWQLEPALAAVGGAARILLADEVGLGKTIQALAIVSELAARGLARRVLILTPASLRDQWAEEMAHRFGLEARIFDQASLATAIAALPAGINPWLTASFIISSIDLVKRAEVRVALDAVPIDVLIVDEAHHLTPGSDRGAVVADLAGRTPSVVLLTGTPHSGDEAAYRFLQTLGRTSDGDELVVYRRTNAEVGRSRLRRVHLLAVRPTRAERAFLDATLEYAKAVWSGPGAANGARLVASTIARRASSSAEVARRTLERRIALIGEIGQEREPSLQAALPWDEDDCDDAVVSDAVLGIAGIEDRASEVAWLERLIALAAKAADGSSKVDVVRRLLGRTREHLILFSEYRDVVQLVASRLADLTTVGTLHGGLTPADRRRVIRQFSDGSVRTLVSTDAAGEGLNLQARCRLVVNLELPWNPLRLEQRIGRVDRLGQTRRVHALHLFHAGSYEDTVLARLERRRQRAALDLAEWSAASESDVAAAIFEDRPLEPRQPSFVGLARRTSCPAARRVAIQRRYRQLANHFPREPTACYATRTRTGHAARAVALLFTANILDGQGRVVQRENVPLRIQCEPPFRRLRRSGVRRLQIDARVLHGLDLEIARRLQRTHTSISASAAGFARRTTAILAALEARRLQTLFQGSLFDRREEQKSHAREAAISVWRRNLEGRLAAASALSTLRSSTPRLVAAWLLD